MQTWWNCSLIENFSPESRQQILRLPKREEVLLKNRPCLKHGGYDVFPAPRSLPAYAVRKSIAPSSSVFVTQRQIASGRCATTAVLLRPESLGTVLARMEDYPPRLWLVFPFLVFALKQTFDNFEWRIPEVEYKSNNKEGSIFIRNSQIFARPHLKHGAVTLKRTRRSIRYTWTTEMR